MERVAEQRVAVVTGGGRGMGASIAQHLAASGMHVAIWDLQPVIDDYKQSPDVAHGSISTWVVDVSSESQIEAAVGQLLRTHGRVDVLVNNAGISPKVDGARVPSLETSTDEWNAVVNVNLTGPFFCIRAIGPIMKDNGWGRIVNTSSTAGRQGARLAGIAYGATKAGINGLTKTFAYELAPHGITVNSICPGRIRTPMADMVSDEVNEQLVARIPVGRVGEESDVAALVSFLVSDDAGFITGTTIDINGGAYIAP